MERRRSRSRSRETDRHSSRRSERMGSAKESLELGAKTRRPMPDANAHSKRDSHLSRSRPFRGGSSFISGWLSQISCERLILCGIAALVLIALAVWGIQNGPAFFSRIGIVLNSFFSHLAFHLCLGLVIWGILMFFVVKKMPRKVKGLSLIMVFAIMFLSQYMPALGELLIILVGIGLILYSLLRR